jgi:hypothetical protein
VAVERCGKEVREENIMVLNHPVRIR